MANDIISSLQIGVGAWGNSIVRFDAVTGLFANSFHCPGSYEPPSGSANDKLGFDYVPADDNTWIDKIGSSDQSEWYNDSGGEDDRINSTCFTQAHIWWIGLNAAGTANLVGLNPDGSIFATYLTTDGNLSFAGGCCADTSGIVYWINGDTTLRRFDTVGGTQLTDVTLSLPIGGRVNIVNLCVTSDGAYFLGVWYEAVASTDYLFVWNSDGSLHWYSTFDESSSHALAGGGACFSSDDLTVYTVHVVPHAVEPTFGVVFDHRVISSSGFGSDPNTFDWVFDPTSTYPGDMILMWLGSYTKLPYCTSLSDRIIGAGQPDSEYPKHAIGTSPWPWTGTSPGVAGTPGTLIPNGGFETGDLTDWSSGGAVLPTVNSTHALSGTFAAFLGQLPGTEVDGDCWIQQDIVVPGISPGYLTLSYLPYTEDGIEFDWQEAQLRDLSDVLLEQIFRVCITSSDWQAASVDLAPYAGTTVRLWINVHQDGSGDVTNMWVDNIEVGGTPTTTNSTFYSPIAYMVPLPNGDFWFTDEASGTYHARASDHTIVQLPMIDDVGDNWGGFYPMLASDGLSMWTISSSRMANWTFPGVLLSRTDLNLGPYIINGVHTFVVPNIGVGQMAPDGTGFFYSGRTFGTVPGFTAATGAGLIKIALGGTIDWLCGKVSNTPGYRIGYTNGADIDSEFGGAVWSVAVDPAQEWVYVSQESLDYFDGTFKFDPPVIRRVSLLDFHSETFCGPLHGVIDLNTYTGPSIIEDIGIDALFIDDQFISLSPDGAWLLFADRGGLNNVDTFPGHIYIIDVATAQMRYFPFQHDPGEDWPTHPIGSLGYPNDPSEPTNLFVGPDGFLYVSDYRGGYITRLVCPSLSKWTIGQIGMLAS